MPTVHLLGTGAAFTDPHRTTTMLAFSDADSVILVDCGGDAVQRLQMAGLDLDALEAVILTHEHPDHVGGFPLLMEKLWLAGRRRPLPVYGPPSGLSQAQRAFATFDTSRWTGLFEARMHGVDLDEGASVLTTSAFRITAAPGDHGVPVIGLRVECLNSDRVVAYSCDTRPSDAIARLGRKGDLFIHEATGSGPVHSSAEEAAEIARKAEAHRLVLVHLPPGLTDADLEDARAVFSSVELGEELATYTV